MTQETVQIGNLTLGAGRPVVAVPITGQTTAAILKQAAAIVATGAQVLVEWRIDCFEDVLDPTALVAAGRQLQAALPGLSLLTTFRTQGEGGHQPTSEAAYFAICQAVITGGFTDALDLELLHDQATIKGLVDSAHQHGMKVIMSSHDFTKTPARAAIIGRLTQMEDLGADLAKVAVMPTSVTDVLTLLAVTHQAATTLPRPVITMAMGDLGKVSRVAGEVFGSALTFATVGPASAPGQIALPDLEAILDQLAL